MFKYNDKNYKLNLLNKLYDGFDIIINNKLNLSNYIKENIKNINLKKQYIIYLNNEKFYIDHIEFVSILLDIANICPSFAYEPNIQNYTLKELQEISKFSQYRYNIYEDPSDISQPSIDDLLKLKQLYNKNNEEFNVFIKSTLPNYAKYSAVKYILENNLYYTTDLNIFLQTLFFNRSENSQLALNYENLTKIYYFYPDIKIFLEELAINENEYVIFLLNKYLYNVPENIFIGLNNALSNFKTYSQKIVLINTLESNGMYYRYDIEIPNNFNDKDKIKLELMRDEIKKVKFILSGYLINFTTKTVKKSDFYTFRNTVINIIDSYKINFDISLKLEIRTISLSDFFVNDIKNYIYLYSKNNSINYSFRVPDAILNKTIIQLKNTDVLTKFKEKFNLSPNEINIIKTIEPLGLEYEDIFNKFNLYSAEAIMKYKNPHLLRLSYDINFHLLTEDILEILNIYINKYNITSILKNKRLILRCENKEDILRLIY